MMSTDDAHYAGRCGDRSPSGHICTRPAEHGGPHQACVIGGPDDGGPISSWVVYDQLPGLKEDGE